MVDTFFISSRKAIIVLFLSWLMLWFGSVIQDLVVIFTEADDKIWLLDVDSEDSLYTWLSTVLLCFAALLAFSRSLYGPDALMWRVIGVLFLLMSVDEMLSLHERVSHLLTSWLAPYFSLGSYQRVSSFYWPLSDFCRSCFACRVEFLG